MQTGWLFDVMARLSELVNQDRIVYEIDDRERTVVVLRIHHRFDL